MISEQWEQILVYGVLVFHAIRSCAQIIEIRQDIDTLQTDNLRLLKWTQSQTEPIVELKSEMIGK